MRRNFIIIFIFLIFIQCGTNQQENKNSENGKTENSDRKNFPKRLDYISDYEKNLTIVQIQELNQILSEYEHKTTNQIAIISINENLNEKNFNQYALDLSNYWGIGIADKNNGLTIVYSSKLRKIRICTGIGTEKILTDEICEKIMNEKILPEFKNGNYYLGLKNGITEFIKLWK